MLVDTDLLTKRNLIKIDAKLKEQEDKNTAQDSSIQSIQEDIEAIQADNSEQSEEITAMKETIAEQSRVIALHEKNAKKAYVEPSTHITVHDAAEMDAKIGVYGNSTQATRSGKNKFNIENKLYGTIDTNGDLKIINGVHKFYEYDFKENMQYTISGNVKNENTTGNVRLAVFYTDGTSDDTVLLNKTATYQYKTFTTAENKTVDCIKTNYGNAGAMYIKEGKLQIEEGTVATEYEEYGISPSPEFPSKIKNCSESINIKNVNKNLAMVAENVETVYQETEKFISAGQKIHIEKAKNNISHAIDLQTMTRTGEYIKGTTTANLVDYHLTPCRGEYLLDVLVENFEGSGGGGTHFVRLITNKRNIDTNFLGSSVTNKSVVLDVDEYIKAIHMWLHTTATTKFDLSILLRKKGTEEGWTKHASKTVTFPLQEGQHMYEGSYPADDGIHHKRTQKEIAISYSISLSNGNKGGVFAISDKFKNFNDMIICSNAIFEKVPSFNDGTVYENQSNVVFCGNSTDTLATLKEKYDGGVVEYKLATEEIEPYTPEQQAMYEKLQKLTLAKGTNNIFCIDEVPAKLDMHYTVATDIITDKLAADIAEIKSMITTTNEGGVTE